MKLKVENVSLKDQVPFLRVGEQLVDRTAIAKDFLLRSITLFVSYSIFLSHHGNYLNE